MKKPFIIAWLVTVAIVAGAVFSIGLNTKVAAKHDINPPTAYPCVPNIEYQQVYNDYQRCQGHGYFTNLWFNYANYPGFSFEGLAWTWGGCLPVIGGGVFCENDMTADGINNVDSFINAMRARLDSWGTVQSYGCQHEVRAWYICTIAKKRATGAAFYINTMLGKTGSSVGCNLYQTGVPVNQVLDPNGNCVRNGVQTAMNSFNDWENLVRAYDAAGRVDWDVLIWYGNNHINHGSMRYGHDNYFVTQASDLQRSIRFRNPDGTSYRIKKNCGNVTGNASPLDFQFNNQAAISGNQIVTPGQTVTMSASIRNQGDLDSPTTKLLLHKYEDTTPGGIQNQIAFQSNPAALALGYSNSSVECPNLNGVRHPCFYWQYSQINVGQTIGVSFSFKIPDNATEGQRVCFRAYAQPRSISSNEHSDGTGCATVVRPRQPFLTTENGSVHAGARFGQENETCYEPNENGGGIYGQTTVTNGSKGEYIVSAGDVIDSFGSANSPTGTGATFGNTPGLGFYGQVCRPDVAKKYLQDSPQLADPLDGDDGVGDVTIEDIGALANGTKGVYRQVGNVTINPSAAHNLVVGQRVTIIVEGSVLIQNNIGANGNFTISTIPSLGVVATGAINISQNVTSLYGIYYAGSALSPANGGIINTCQNNFSLIPGNPAITTTTGTVACSQPLTVTGAFIANTVYFRRTAGDVNTGSQAAETLNLIPQVLLRPPVGLGGAAVQIRNQGERPPVY